MRVLLANALRGSLEGAFWGTLTLHWLYATSVLATGEEEDNSALAAFVYLSQVFRVDSFIYRLFQLYIRDNRFPPLHHSPPPWPFEDFHAGYPDVRSLRFHTGRSICRLGQEVFSYHASLPGVGYTVLHEPACMYSTHPHQTLLTEIGHTYLLTL